MAAIVDIANEKNGLDSIRTHERVGTAQVWIEAGTTDEAEAAIWHHVVSSFAIFVWVEGRSSLCVLLALLCMCSF